MRLNQLEYLLAVAREGSYQNAAKRLGVSQSTISVAIKNLEEELAFQLVQRSGKGVALTKKGQLVVEKAASIELDMREMQNLRHAFLDEIAGTFIICGASHNFNLQLVDLIIRLRENYPRLQLWLEDRNNLDVIQEVSQRKCLLGLVQLNSIDDIFYQNEMRYHNLDFTKIDEGKMYFAVGRSHPYFNKNVGDINSFLSRSTMIFRYQVSALFEKYFKQHGYKERIVIINDTFTSRHLVENSNFYTTLFPEFGFYHDNDIYQQHLTKVDLSDFECFYQSGWVTRRSGYSPREQFIIRLIQHTWQEMKEERSHYDAKTIGNPGSC